MMYLPNIALNNYLYILNSLYLRNIIKDVFKAWFNPKITLKNNLVVVLIFSRRYKF